MHVISQDRLQAPITPRDPTQLTSGASLSTNSPAQVQSIKSVRDHHQGVRPVGRGGPRSQFLLGLMLWRAMGFNGRTHFEFRHPSMRLPLPGLPSLSTFYDPFFQRFTFTSHTVYRTMFFGSNTLTTRATRSLSFLCFDRIVVSLFNLTCTLFSLSCVISIPPATVSSCGKPVATIYGHGMVVFRETPQDLR
ncbi:hypothetical protein BGY98DRAFT_993640 [Russula aff. rugulosa BPL654]|nr:hypothetical protein BGY98DRAFT_993640 [Russula aff. rugulosa BPL654]